MVLFTKCFDLFFFILLFFAFRENGAATGRFDPHTFFHAQISIPHLMSLLVLSFILNRLFTIAGLYRTGSHPSRTRWLGATLAASSMGVVAVASGAHLAGMARIDGLHFGYYWIAATMVLVARRCMFRVVARLTIRSNKIRHVLIAGVNKRSLAVAQALRGPNTKISFFDFPDRESALDGSVSEGDDLLIGMQQDFNRFISLNAVDEVVITLPIRSCYDSIQNLIALCAAQGIKTCLSAYVFDVPASMIQSVWTRRQIPLINYQANRYPELQQALKRLVDIVVSISALILLIPVFLVVAVLILIDDGFPVFFIQERVGFRKHRFSIFKFRTMVKDAEQMQDALESKNIYGNGAAFKITDDPRIIPIGHFLRKTSLDELPQLINVLLGTMSLVGPRPLPIRDFQRFYSDRHRLRFSVKPGLTGLWQVSGRNEVEFEEWMELDIQYVNHWSLTLDLKILVKSFFVVLSGKGAK